MRSQNYGFKRIANLFTIVALLIASSGIGLAEQVKIRVAHFPNVTHAPALIARAAGHFEKIFGAETAIEWVTFNAGPEAIEALFAGAIDILYVGPNPAVNGYVRSKGEALRIVAGVSAGGAAFVIRADSDIKQFEDIRGRRVASPQKGNSQDVALLHWMHEKDLKPRSQGGDVEVFNIAGGDQITALLKKQVDAIWTVEPWVSRLVAEANGKILFEEEKLWPDGKYATTLLVVRKKFLDQNREIVGKWVAAHIEMIQWINQNASSAKQVFNEELKRETGKPLPPTYLNQSFERIAFTFDSMKTQVTEAIDHAFMIGYLGRGKNDLSNLYDLSFLNSENQEIRKQP